MVSEKNVGHEGQLYPVISNVVDVLKACAKAKDLHKGSEIHAYLWERKLLEKNCYVACTLVSMYATCGAFFKAQQVLDELPCRDVMTWTALIAGYAQLGQGKQALKCFDCMQQEGHTPDAVTFTCALKACSSTTSMGADCRGRQIHDKIVSLGLLKNNIVLGTALVDMYARCGALAKAQEVLEELPVRDVITWNALIASYAQQGHAEKALKCFESMEVKGQSPDVVTFICVLKACGSIGSIAKGEVVHDKLVRLGLLKKSIVLGNSLVDMYAKCGALAKAEKVLQELPARDLITWNTLIGGYAQQELGEEALKCFERMQTEGHFPDAITFIYALKACASIGAVSKGKEIHDRISNLGLLEKDIMLGSTLMDMYARCGALAKAQQVFNNLPVRDAIMWTALIAGYAQQGQGEDALKCFDTMQHEGHSVDVVIFICVLKACGGIGAAAKGEQIHERIRSLGLLEESVLIGSALVDMYVKCGALAKAQGVLEELPFHDVITWNALIGGHAQQGQSEEAWNCLGRMQAKGASPDSTTLVCMLNAYSNSGLIDEAQMYILRMSSTYNIILDIEHYCCMVDLFGRAGDINKALAVIEKMPSADYLPIWLALLGACHKWADVTMGRLAFEHAVCVDKNGMAAYTCMANIYTATGTQEDTDEIGILINLVKKSSDASAHTMK